MRRLVLIALTTVMVGVVTVRPTGAASPAAERAFAQFWRAATPAQASSAVGAVVKSGVSFDEAVALLKRGRPYAANAPTGIVARTHRLGDLDFPYTVEVPASYSPSKRYQVRVQLHGGVGRPDGSRRGNGIGSLAGAEQIYVMPTAWAAAEWWTDRQVENLRAILDRVKRAYNVDENRIVLSGVSDGGTGTYYVAMRDVTPYASFLPLNGAIAVLRSSSVERDGEMFMNNMLNKPFFIVNGGRDPLYPTSLVEPYIAQMKKGGVTLTYLPQPEAVHNTAWWPEVKDRYEAFVREHPRSPYPDRVTWETDMTAGTNRADWLVIDALATAGAETAPLPDVNDVALDSMPNFGVRNVGTRVTAVTAGSNAESFGLKAGDLIRKIGPRVIPPPVDVVDLLSVYDSGTPMTLTVDRGGSSLDLKGTYNPGTAPRIVPYFEHVTPTGRVDLVRDGNTVTATTRGVGAFTLLLSPDVFDFSKPVKIVADGKTRFEARVTPSVATLMKWAAHDNDRTMLFGAEVKVTLTP